MRFRAIFTLPVLVAVAVAVAFGSPELNLQTQPKESLIELLNGLDQETAQIKDLTAHFKQQKHSIMLRKPLESSGRVWVLGDQIKWETRSPRNSIMLIDNRSATLFDQESNHVEIYPLSAGLAAIIGTPLPQFHILQESFLIEQMNDTDDLTLKLTPLDKELGDHIESVLLTLDRTIPAVIRMELEDAEGDRTVITFSKIELNQGLSQSDITLHYPSDVVIEYPMGPILKED